MGVQASKPQPKSHHNHNQNPGHDSTRRKTGIHHVRRHAVTRAATRGSSPILAAGGELVGIRLTVCS